MKRVVDMAFVVVVLACILSVVATKTLDVLGVNFPGWTGIGIEKFELEGRTISGSPKLSVQNIADHSFQSQAESYISDRVPMRTQLVLTNAALQRGCIATANTVFHYDCYPTAFESGRVVIPSQQSIAVTSIHHSVYNDEAVDTWVATINATAEQYPKVRFMYDVVEETYVTESNPTHALISEAYNHSFVEEHILSKINPRITVIDDRIKTKEELFTEWFSTDHHWTVSRSLKSYNQIAYVMGWDQVNHPSFIQIEDSWYGSSARIGLCLDYTDEMWDTTIAFDWLECYRDGRPYQRGLRDAYLRGDDVTWDVGFNSFYSMWFGRNSIPEVIYINTENTTGRVCLFVTHSYGTPLERYVAMNYQTTICIDPRNNRIDKTMSEYIDEYEVDDVVILLGYAYLSLGRETSPIFFGFAS